MTMQITSTAPQAPVAPSRGRLRPLGQNEVRITGGFWGDRQSVNAAGTLRHIGARLESEGWLPNFDLAVVGGLPERRRGREFSDSEVYKYLEALAWEIGRTDDAALEQRFREVVARVAAAQEADGYLNTRFGHPGQGSRWSDLEWGHELYCLGHLFQAAVARERTRPGADDGLLGIAVRAADLVCIEFGAQGRDAICGHAEVEVGLAELARVTGEPRYLEQARLFVERHGQGTLRDIEWGRRYFQDDVAVRDAGALRGHAVRANYLASGATDVAIDTGDDELLASLRRQWDRTTARRTYVTGGQGSHHQDEAFGEDWELPADRAYSETCAGVGSIMFSWRLLLAGGDARHADLIERTLYNVVATSPAPDGRAFFYANTLHQRVPGVPADPEATSPRASSSLRAPWFEVSCCPPNVARTLASLDAYIATADDEGVQLHQYAPARVRTALPDGRVIAFDVETDYPVSGRIRVISRTDAAPGAEWTLTLRVPAWGDGARVRVVPADGGAAEERDAAPGAVEVRRAFRPGDVVELDLPMAPRLTAPDERIDAVRGCLAIERGPEVFALESVDLAVAGVDDVAQVALAPGAAPVDRDGRVWIDVVRHSGSDAGWPYGERVDERGGAASVAVPLVRYHEWAERGPSTMRVWIPAAT
ncbi:glycoside hydrolase family 127 protein [Microbacterium trichothecenolyticum]|uniref:Non-reducing end beta-L-arabinofuranosidase n=1 Tax=Microbacterium trichothecenolyticum TaxID=69370 RepID=A0A0M2HH90_MICTR|nr:beta-L-arabinofuranosidase domain-containing protein [Microbacterium trichothecenolyticum]KJL43670.1 Non-reducing end beta-L-arabinofuranosidase [Microbacterium trichothecenolyticum]